MEVRSIGKNRSRGKKKNPIVGRTLSDQRRKALSDDVSEKIPEHWYEKRESKFVCLRCHKVFKGEYKSKSFHRKKKVHGANMLSLWAWHNFRRHLLRCWGWRHDNSGDE